MRSFRPWLKLSVGMLATGFCLWLVVRKMDWNDTWLMVQQADAGWLLTALALLAVGYAARVFRWWNMLRAMSVALPVSACAGPFLSSVALNNVLPFRAGDILRVVGFRRHLDIDPIPVMSTLILERLLDLSVLLGFFFLGLIQIDDGAFPSAVIVATGWMTLLCFLLVICIVLLPRRLLRLVAMISGVAERRSWSPLQKITDGVHHFFDSLVRMQSRRLLLRLIAFSIAIWLLEGTVFYSVARAVHITDAGAGPWFALATGTLGTLLPSTPGYIGTFDYFTMLGLMAYHVAQPVAAVFALAVHLVLWLPLTIIGLGWLLVHKAKRSAVSLNMAPPLAGSS